MMLDGWRFTEFTKRLQPRQLRLSGTEPAPQPTSEPTPNTCALVVAPPRRAQPKPNLHQPTAKEHAQRLLEWIRDNIDFDGLILHSAILEFYTEMLIETGWVEHKWNPVAHQFRLLTTGTRKIYAWVPTTTGTPHRLRIYPIPRDALTSGGKRKNITAQPARRIA